MSAKPRCHECGHRRGSRRTNLTKAEPKRAKKLTCRCACHQAAAK